MELKFLCPCCGTETTVNVDLDDNRVRYELERNGWRKRKPMDLTPEERERRRLQGEKMMGRGRPKGLKNKKERIDKGTRRGSMRRGSEL